MLIRQYHLPSLLRVFSDDKVELWSVGSTAVAPPFSDSLRTMGTDSAELIRSPHTPVVTRMSWRVGTSPICSLPCLLMSVELAPVSTIPSKTLVFDFYLQEGCQVGRIGLHCWKSFGRLNDSPFPNLTLGLAA